MNPFAYVRASDSAEAITRGAEPAARYIAGGTNILDLMKVAVESPATLVDINALPLSAIDVDDARARIGALARMSDVAAHPAMRAHFPLIAIALEQSASPQLRNMASIAGNLLQRTRCPYFRDVAAACNKRNLGSGCDALEGDNRREAVLGVSEDCIATHASDLAVALAALDTTVHVSGPRGDRVITLNDFYRLPGTTPQFENTLAHGEMIVAAEVGLLPPGTRSTYLKVRDRAQYDFALASAAVAVQLEAGAIREARIALGGVGTKPWRTREAENALRGASPSRDAFARAADAALAGAHVRDGNAYKVPLAKRTLIRALEMVSS